MKNLTILFLIFFIASCGNQTAPPLNIEEPETPIVEEEQNDISIPETPEATVQADSEPADESPGASWHDNCLLSPTSIQARDLSPTSEGKIDRVILHIDRCYRFNSLEASKCRGVQRMENNVRGAADADRPCTELDL